MVVIPFLSAVFSSSEWLCTYSRLIDGIEVGKFDPGCACVFAERRLR